MSDGNQRIYLTDILFPWLLGTKLTVGHTVKKLPHCPGLCLGFALQTVRKGPSVSKLPTC